MVVIDSYLRCTVCGRTSTTTFAGSLRSGWERCCGYTMRLERTDADIADGLAAGLSDAVPQAATLARFGHEAIGERIAGVELGEKLIRVVFESGASMLLRAEGFHWTPAPWR